MGLVDIESGNLETDHMEAFGTSLFKNPQVILKTTYFVNVRSIERNLKNETETMRKSNFTNLYVCGCVCGCVCV